MREVRQTQRQQQRPPNPRKRPDDEFQKKRSAFKPMGCASQLVVHLNATSLCFERYRVEGGLQQMNRAVAGIDDELAIRLLRVFVSADQEFQGEPFEDVIVGGLEIVIDSGEAQQMKAKLRPGDEMDIHHIPDKHQASATVRSYDPDNAPPIALRKLEHRRISSCRPPDHEMIVPPNSNS